MPINVGDMVMDKPLIGYVEEIAVNFAYIVWFGKEDTFVSRTPVSIAEILKCQYRVYRENILNNYG